ncbi:hypothetical protein OUZ56_013129 [Daphnia magna]|uniref:Uncharacterized protein n=1 Tax=Daphnia magna TaxID=35525 RepID=A0ABQ9Z523_9CRUS|nr:hypothetical protein OUZ56_013129 [Daphnia magna]
MQIESWISQKQNRYLKLVVGLAQLRCSTTKGSECKKNVFAFGIAKLALLVLDSKNGTNRAKWKGTLKYDRTEIYVYYKIHFSESGDGKKGTIDFRIEATALACPFCIPC